MAHRWVPSTHIAALVVLLGVTSSCSGLRSPQGAHDFPRLIDAAAEGRQLEAPVGDGDVYYGDVYDGDVHDGDVHDRDPRHSDDRSRQRRSLGGGRGEAPRGDFDAVDVNSGDFDFSHLPQEITVQLYLRRVFFAPRWGVHPLFLAFDPSRGEWETWDVWNPRWLRPGVFSATKKYSGAHPDETTTVEVRATGNVRQTRNVTRLWRSGSNVLMAQWQGEPAARLLAVLRRPGDYPYKESYHIWPGPNSNTYHRWVLQQAGVAFDPHPLAVGKDYLGLWGFGLGVTPTRTGLQLETPILGAKVGILDGVELHLLALTFGIDLWPPALKLPTGRYGFAE